MSDYDDESYGPALPPWMKKSGNNSSSLNVESERRDGHKIHSKQHHSKSDARQTHNEDTDEYCPSLPPHLVNKLKTETESRDPGSHRQSHVSSSVIKIDDDYCPPLPLHLKNRKQTHSNERFDSDKLTSSQCSADISGKNKIIKTGKDSCVSPFSKSHHKQKLHENETVKLKSIARSNDEDDGKEEECYGAALPPHLLNKNTKSSTTNDEYYGAALPPHLINRKNNIETSNVKVVGPCLPSGYQPPSPSAASDHSDNSSSVVDDDDEEMIVGPLPSTSHFDEKKYRIEQLELRAKKMKDKLTGKEDDEKPLVRETWMTELPDGKTNLFGLGLAPRQFRKKAVELGDRSVWTDTPEDKEKKAKMGKDSQTEAEMTPELIATKNRDEELSKLVSNYNTSKRGSALIDMHQVKTKKKKEETSSERRPFSREDDMNVNKFDDAQKSAILKKARKLDDRFSAGGQRFL